jgi:hypothetical protein
VTTPTVSTPRSRAARATTGAAPVPVPPPMPAVMKHMWTPSSAWSISPSASSAAAAPISGRAPAPRPCVIFRPSWMRVSAGDRASACASVLATHEVDALQAIVDHVGDGVAAGPTDPDHADLRLQFHKCRFHEIKGHGWAPSSNLAFKLVKKAGEGGFGARAAPSPRAHGHPGKVEPGLGTMQDKAGSVANAAEDWASGRPIRPRGRPMRTLRASAPAQSRQCREAPRHRRSAPPAARRCR